MRSAPRSTATRCTSTTSARNEDGTPDDNWNKAIANTAFRQCFIKGLDLTRYFSRTNPINPLKCENDTYTMPGVCYNSDNVEYSKLVCDKMGYGAYDGETMIRLRDNGGDIADLKQQAMDELSAIGVTFPVHAHYHIQSGNTTSQDSAAVLRQCFTDSFGDDFIVLDIGEYVSSVQQEIVNAHLHGFVINGWGADFGDPINFLGQETLTDATLTTATTTAILQRLRGRPRRLAGRPDLHLPDLRADGP